MMTNVAKEASDREKSWLVRLVVLYTVAGGGYVLAGGDDGEGPAGGAVVAAKCAPVLALAVATAWKACQGGEGWGRAACTSGGLWLSAAGDALLARARLLPGMALFAGAHAAYCAAWPRRPALPARAAALLLLAWVVVRCLRVEAALRAAVAGYAAALCGSAWRGGAAGGAAAAGAALFALSDACLALHLFRAPLPHHQLIVMSTYYAAQLLIALSALAPPAPAPSAGPAPEDHDKSN